MTKGARLRRPLAGFAPPILPRKRGRGVRAVRETPRRQVVQPVRYMALGASVFLGAEPADKPGPVLDSHSSRRNVTVTLKQPTRTRRGQRHEVPIWPCSRWGLPCRPVARLAVRSYRTISPLPAPGHPKMAGPLAVSFCCTFRRLAPPRRYLARCP